jgi:16S rRNA processing protein RimM
MKERFLQVGEIIKPHGIYGEVGVKSLTEWPDLRFRPGEKLWLGPDEENLKQVTLSKVRSHKQGYLILFESVNDRNSAEEIRGWKFYIPADQAAVPEEGCYFHFQLIGLSVLDESGDVIGQVTLVIENPGQDILEIKLGSLDGKQVLVPLVEEIVREVDLEAGTLTVALPEGLLDI